MKIFTCTDHAGHWPVGVASVVVADTEEHAKKLLAEELKTHGLDGAKPFTLDEICITEPHAIVLMDGEY